MSNIDLELREFVVDNYLFGQTNGLTDETSFLDAGIIDSTGVLELVSFLQTKYGIHLEDDEIVPENLDSLQRLNAFVRAKQSAAGLEVGRCS